MAKSKTLKFSLGADTVEFSSFKITPDTVQASDNVLQDIIDFPTPKTPQTYVHGLAWPIRSPTHGTISRTVETQDHIYWDDELQQIFEVSKREIIKDIEDGARIFDKSKPTCLATD